MVTVLVLGAVLVGAFIIRQGVMMDIHYTQLLDVIAEGESKGNYNAYFGKAHNTAIDFTSMPVGDVLAWQRKFVADGNASNAVGRYQFIEPTLSGLVNEMGIDPDERFTPGLQDKLAVRLLERRGIREYMQGRLSREDFAHNLSKEWAALPRVIGDQSQSSYYSGDGLNHAQITVKDVFVAIESLHDTDES